MIDLPLLNPRPEGPPRAAGLIACAIGLLLGGATASGQVSPEESARQLKPAAGLEATLWAAEPMVVNPTTIDVDSRGRVWVTEGLNYRLTRGRNREFGRIDDADKIKILEDTDGDGKADKVTVFADRIFPVPMGIAVEENWGADGKYKGCKVYVGNSPNLLVVEDTDGDDKADRRYPLLTGFGGIDSDHGVHGPFLALDGKIYFTHGDGCCSVQPDRSERVENFDVTDKSGRRVSSDQLANTLRVNRDGTQFEVIADRQRNNYETANNSFGNGFTSDNDDDGNRGSRVIWVMDGGKYGYRTPGSPRHWGEEVPGNVPKLVGTGNGSPCGVAVYEGGLLPKEYFGAVFEAEAGPRVIFAHPIVRKGAAFRTEPMILLASDDPWFRPVDVTANPDGSLMVADWYDAGVGGHAFSDQTTGRIYRVAPAGNKSKVVKYDFATIPGLVEALKSPNVATQDVARRLLIAKGHTPEIRQALARLFVEGQPIHKARSLWVAHAIVGDPLGGYLLGGEAPDELKAVLRDDPRLREQLVRMLGRDCRDNGKVEYQKAEARQPALASAHLDLLKSLVNDPDAGVRRELILAFRNLPTEGVGDPLRTLAASWDGQDRWYLEALALALKDRESDYLAKLFDGTLYGDLNLAATGTAGPVALPPYFPVDRNEAFISMNDPELPPANALTKTIGLAWALRRPEALGLVTRVLPSLATPALQQAADDVLTQIPDKSGAFVLAELAAKSDDPSRKRQVLGTLARRLDGPWKGAETDPRVAGLIDAALKDPALRLQGVALAVATRDPRHGDALFAAARDVKAPMDVRVAALEGLARAKNSKVGSLVELALSDALARKASDPFSEAAVAAMALDRDDADKRLTDVLRDVSWPMGLRRAALKALAGQPNGGRKVLNLAGEKTLPDDLVKDATALLYADTNRAIREDATRMLPPPKTAEGKPLPPIFELVRSEGDVEKGRAVFYTAGADNARQACGACHRVQGRGQWVGPDLSTIGAKSGKDELIRSILNPSEAIGYNFRTVVAAQKDGRVVSGLLVEETPDRLVLKTAEGKRVEVRTADLDDRAFADISLMPEGLASQLKEQELVDLLAFLSTLKQPVSVVGEAQAVGPIAGADAKPQEGAAWRRLTADAEGRLDLASIAGDDPKSAAFLRVSVTSSVAQDARLVLDTRADLRAWLGDKELALPAPSEDGPRTVAVKLDRGSTELRIRVAGGKDAAIVATFVADRPVEFGADSVKVSAR